MYLVENRLINLIKYLMKFELKLSFLRNEASCEKISEHSELLTHFHG